MVSWLCGTNLFHRFHEGLFRRLAVNRTRNSSLSDRPLTLKTQLVETLSERDSYETVDLRNNLENYERFLLNELEELAKSGIGKHCSIDEVNRHSNSLDGSMCAQELYEKQLQALWSRTILKVEKNFTKEKKNHVKRAVKLSGDWPLSFFHFISPSGKVKKTITHDHHQEGRESPFNESDTLNDCSWRGTDTNTGNQLKPINKQGKVDEENKLFPKAPRKVMLVNSLARSRLPPDRVLTVRSKRLK
ncbi:unnamed protein product [Mesocestoides corti]|uniref:Ribosome biogenesis protein NOP53 n=1 Tax=Mesocestoides corti TaxID=53468 RepID=A0A0R3UEH9_MESCO|nr:unnamed protein product [Mesocestoides corti]